MLLPVRRDGDRTVSGARGRIDQVRGAGRGECTHIVGARRRGQQRVGQRDFVHIVAVRLRASAARGRPRGGAARRVGDLLEVACKIAAARGDHDEELVVAVSVSWRAFAGFHFQRI